MSSRFAAFAVLALAGAHLCASEPASAAGGVRAIPGGSRAPLIMHRNARAALLPRGFHGFHPQNGRFAHPKIPPSPHGFATTTPLRPFDRLQRRHFGRYQSGWDFPVTTGDNAGYGYIGTPYDPGEAFPVYAPMPATQGDDSPPRAAPAVAARLPQATEENRDACRSERITVPAAEGERAITVVRC
jgi:hypothetical protein